MLKKILLFVATCFLSLSLPAQPMDLVSPDLGPEAEMELLHDRISRETQIANSELMNWANREMQLARESRDSLAVGRAHLSLGRAWRNEDELFRQLDHLYKSYEIAVSLEDSRLRAESAYEIGSTLMYFVITLGGDGGDKYLNEAYKRYQQLGDTLGMVRTMVDLGLLQRQEQQFDSSFYFYAEAERLGKMVGDTFDLSRIYNNKSDYFQRGDIFDQDSVLFYAQKALEFSHTHPRNRAVALMNLGIGEFEFGEVDSALAHMHRGIEISERIRPSALMGAGCNALYLMYRRLGRYKEALSYFKCYFDRSQLFEKQKTLARFEVGSRKNERELELVLKDIAIQEARLENQRNLIIFGSVVLGLSLLGLLMIMQKNRVIRRQNADLEDRNAQVRQMLAEIHHRVKNNLQMIVGLLDLQHAAIQDDSLSVVLNDARNRVNSIALVHQKLYRGQSDHVNLGFHDYIFELTRHLLYVYQMDERVELDLEVDELEMSFEKAIVMGLLVNELVTNSLKHGFRDRESGRLTIRVKQQSEWILLKVQDDGPGFPDNFDQERTDSFGLDLIRSFASDLGGNIRFYNDGGAVAEARLQEI